ncbi:Aste57867_18526 [Aphanomyces stellatus]|uniref:Aste57867_18526 protein n=1 Tax=Aphanomyces stellatus TaxID=120398 RepID=A0A485LC53_9STRA|nr:hypothetical protein As57867_018464 [Aphanomyces stellatus]VFT95262.1 Aste57867_18526 [Aphanomyces stellatus]
MRKRLFLAAAATAATMSAAPSTLPPIGAWEASTCGGKLLARSSEFGCALDRCKCWSVVSTCDDSLGCLDGSSSACLGQCRLTPLGIALNVLRWLFVLGCPITVFGYHVLKIRRSLLTVATDDAKNDDVDGRDHLEEFYRKQQVMDIVMDQVHEQRRMMGRVLWRVMHPLANKAQIEAQKRRRRGRRAMPPPLDDQYMTLQTPTSAATIQFPPDEMEAAVMPLDEYIDLGKLNTGHTHGGYVINMHPQIYLETMRENVVPNLLAWIFVILVAMFVAAVHPFPLDASTIELTPGGVCVDAHGQYCSRFNWTIMSSTSLDVTMQHDGLPHVPDVVALEMQLDTAGAARPTDYVLGLYQLSLTGLNPRQPLIQAYVNKLATACVGEVCANIPLASVLLDRYDTSLVDVRDQTYHIALVFGPSSSPLPPFHLVLTAYSNPFTWIQVSMRTILGLLALVYLGHYLRALSLHFAQRHPDVSTSIYVRMCGHLSLERQLLALVLLFLAIHHCPLLLVPSLPWFGSPPHAYVVFRTVFETLFYVALLGSLLVVLDAYRQDARRFTNGISLSIVSVRSIVVKGALVGGVLALRLTLTLALERRFGSTVNIAQWVSLADTLLLVGAISVFFYVTTLVHHVLETQRYSETRYLSLSFRYLTVIAFAILAILLLNTVFLATYAQVSTTKSTQVPASPLVTDVGVTGLVFFAVLAFYPPSKLESGRIPRGYVIRERRQFVSTPQEISPSAATTMTPRPSTPSSPHLHLPGGGTLRRMTAFRAKPSSHPHRLFCIETACLLLNCSRHAYYRSSLNLPADTGEDGVVKYPATSYVNQFALLRDGLEEATCIHDVETDTHCVVLHTDFKIIFAFRGTDSRANVKTDLEFALDSVPWLPPAHDVKQTPFVHRGFLTAYAAVREQCHAALKDLLARYDDMRGCSSTAVQVYCTGHSLGGALATLAALDFKLNLRQAAVLYNYGSPRVGTHSFSRVFNSEIPLAFRLVNEGDIICGLPQRVTTKCFGQSKKLYKHVGTEVVMDGKVNGDFIIRPTFAEKDLIVEVRKKPGRHYLKGYKENLDVILDSALQSELKVGDFRVQNALEEALYQESMDEESDA